MATIKINELPTSSINSTDFLVKADGNGLATKNTIENLLSSVADLNGNSSELFEVSNGLSGNDAVNVTQLDIIENELFDKIQDEEGDRQSADTTLQNNINTEATARATADTTLQNNIDLKVNISSIVNNVTAGGSGVPLSAEQGKLLKAEILALAGSLIPQGNWDADTNDPDISGTTETGYFWIVSVDGSTDIGGITDWKVNDWVIKTADGFAKIDNTDKVISVAGKIGEVVLAKADVGLSNVDNTTDANKPISTAQQTALDLKANLAGGNTITGEQKHNNSGTGTAIDVNNTSTGTGIDILNNLEGFGLYVNNNGAGSAIEVAGTSSGFNFVGKDNAVNTFTVDKEGNVIGLSFSGDGSLLTNMPVSSSQQTALDLKANKASPSFTGNATFGGNVETKELKTNGGTTITSIEDWLTKANTTFSLANPSTKIGIGYDSSDNGLIQGFNTNGAKKIGIQVYGGDTGFGTSTPSHKVDVNGTFRAVGNATFGGNVGVNSTPTTYNNFTTFSIGNSSQGGVLELQYGGAQAGRIAATSAGTIKINTNNVDRLAIDSNGDFDFKSGNATFGGNVSLLSGYTSTGVYPVEKGITFQTTNGSSVWKTGEILGYVKANNGTTSDFPGGLVFRTKIPGTATEGMLDAMFLSSQGDLEAVGNATFGGSVQADSYKSSDGSVGETQTIDVGNDTYMVFKNGILTEVLTP